MGCVDGAVTVTNELPAVTVVENVASAVVDFSLLLVLLPIIELIVVGIVD